MATQSMCMIIPPSLRSKNNILVSVSPTSTLSSPIHHPHCALRYRAVSNAMPPGKAQVVSAGLEHNKDEQNSYGSEAMELFTKLVWQHYNNADLILIENTGDLAKEIYDSIDSHRYWSQSEHVTNKLLLVLTPDIHYKRIGPKQKTLIIRFVEYKNMQDFRKIIGEVDSNDSQILIVKKDQYFFNPIPIEKECLSKDRLRDAFEYLFEQGGETISIPEIFFGRPVMDA